MAWAVIPSPLQLPTATRREAEGRTNREIRRNLVRCISRHLYRLLEQATLARPMVAGELSPAHLAPGFDASLCRLPPSPRPRQYRDFQADALGDLTHLTVVLRPRRHPWFMEVGAR